MSMIKAAIILRQQGFIYRLGGWYDGKYIERYYKTEKNALKYAEMFNGYAIRLVKLLRNNTEITIYTD